MGSDYHDLVQSTKVSDHFWKTTKCRIFSLLSLNSNSKTLKLVWDVFHLLNENKFKNSEVFPNF